MSKSAIGTSKTIYEIRSMLNAQRLSFRWCKVTEILKIWLLWQIWRINLPYKNEKRKLPIALIINKLKRVKKITLLWIFLWICHKNAHQHQIPNHNLTPENESRPNRSIHGFIRPVHEVYQFLQAKAHIFCSEKSKKWNRTSGLCFTSILHQLWAGKRNGHPLRQPFIQCIKF